MAHGRQFATPTRHGRRLKINNVNVRPMNDPVLVEVLRGGLVESRHRGAVAVVDADNRIVLSVGDVNRLVFPRSAVKGLQGLVLVESGAAERYRLTEAELALVCASHSGEPDHVAAAQSILSHAGLSAAALRCGAHPPIHQPSAAALYRAGQAPSALHNNCSGKHSGFLCAACHMGADPQSYIEPGNPVQGEVRSVIASLSEAPLTDAHRAVDGCSVPTWALPLRNLALAFARFGTGQMMLPTRAKAAARLRAACAAHPWYVAGSGRFCTEVMRRFGERVFVKTGAEGMMCAALPIEGFGVAVKCDDGAGRAAEVIMAALIARLCALSETDRCGLEPFLRPTLRNWNGIVVGELRPTGALLDKW
jgi:L-asparaginase II